MNVFEQAMGVLGQTEVFAGKIKVQTAAGTPLEGMRVMLVPIGAVKITDKNGIAEFIALPYAKGTKLSYDVMDSAGRKAGVFAAVNNSTTVATLMVSQPATSTSPVVYTSGGQKTEPLAAKEFPMELLIGVGGGVAALLLLVLLLK